MANRDLSQRMYRALGVLALMIFLAGTALRADESKTDNLSCDGKSAVITDRQYQQQAGDVLGPHHLEIARPFTGTGSLNVSVCNAQLKVLTKPEGKELRVSVELGDKSDRPAADFIRILRIAPDNGVIHFIFPDHSHAVVTVAVPLKQGLESQFNVGRGDLNFDAIGSAGERQINVGLGHAKLLVEGDKSYADMQVNIGMGSLHDHRLGGHDGHFVVSKTYSGSGVGSLQVNVGMGSLDIAQE
jgi:hypothetical protein